MSALLLQVRLYSLEELAAGQQVVAQPEAVLRMPSKISCVSWSPDADGVITIGDYDGGLTQVSSRVKQLLRCCLHLPALISWQCCRQCRSSQQGMHASCACCRRPVLPSLCCLACTA